jgi:hypothetical protein
MKKVNLIQQTYLIHFEHKDFNKKVSLLRMSELKPRITNFIKNDLKKVDTNLYNQYKDLIENKEIFPEDRGCSFFRLKVNPKSVFSKKIKTYVRNKNDVIEGSYFGKCLGVMFNDIEIEVFSYIKRLEELVAKSFKSFLVINNLGQRQSKGFGGFVVKNTTKEEFETYLSKYYKYVFCKTTDKFYSDVLNDYQLLKSGINKSYFDKNGVYHQGKYEKSLLFLYGCYAGYRWEKRKIKEELEKVDILDDLKFNHSKPADCKNEKLNYAYLRAMLGVASFINFQQKNSKKPFAVKISSKKIERFQSPIIFKKFNNTLYACANPLPEEIFDVEFEFKPDKGKEFYLKTPKQFDLGEFLIWAFTKRLNYKRLNNG